MLDRISWCSIVCWWYGWVLLGVGVEMDMGLCVGGLEGIGGIWSGLDGYGFGLVLVVSAWTCFRV